MQLKPGLVQRGANKEENKELKFTKEQLEKPGFFGPEQKYNLGMTSEINKLLINKFRLEIRSQSTCTSA